MQTGWLGGGPLEELPAGRMAREILSAPETLEEVRRAQNAERFAGDEHAQRVDDMEQAARLAAMRGEGHTSAGQVLARAADGLADERITLDRRRQAREILAQHGLADVVEGSFSAVIDANLGFLPVRRSGGRSMEAMMADVQERKDAAAREERESVGLAAVSRARSLRLSRDPWLNWGR